MQIFTLIIAALTLMFDKSFSEMRPSYYSYNAAGRGFYFSQLSRTASHYYRKYEDSLVRAQRLFVPPDEVSEGDTKYSGYFNYANFYPHYCGFNAYV